jgi:uncharacterized protein (DUF1684 family)
MGILKAVNLVLEDIGTNVLENFLNVPALSRIMRAIDSGGGSEIKRLETQLLARLRPTQSPLQSALRGIDKDFLEYFKTEDAANLKKGMRKPRRSDAKAHQAWLNDNHWRFDWRSQPRRPAGTEAGGEWMEGRLDYPVAVKYHVSRRQRQRRTRAMKAYKARQAALGVTKTRTIRSSWGDY